MKCSLCQQAVKEGEPSRSVKIPTDRYGIVTRVAHDACIRLARVVQGGKRKKAGR